MRADDLRSMSAEELATKEKELRETLARLSMKRHARRLDKTSDLEMTKRDLARVLTVRAEKARSASGGRNVGA